MAHRVKLSEHSWVDIAPCWIPESVAEDLMHQITEAMPFEQRSITLFGKVIPQPRLVAWCGSLPYRYSGLTLPALPVPDCLRDVLHDASRCAETPFNHILLNLYRDGQDSMGMHADNEPELGQNPVVASLSLGAPRRFVLRSRQTKHTTAFELGSGTLLVMGGWCQHEYVHGIAKTARQCDPRLSLTFRHLLRHPRALAAATRATKPD